jgi:hypothetical protein
VSMMRSGDALEPETLESMNTFRTAALAQDGQPCCDMDRQPRMWICEFHEGYDAAVSEMKNRAMAVPQ